MRTVLFLTSGKPTRGSWQIRGLQIARELGMKAEIDPERAEIERHDLVCIVKKVRPEIFFQFKRRPIILDILDSWPQPMGNAFSRSQAVAYMKRVISDINPVGVIFPTHKMQEDIGDNGYVSTVIYHHSRGIEKNSPRIKVGRVGYEGSARYLEEWEEPILEACERLGWEFVVNPEDLTKVDILLSVRGGKWRGYVTDNWKSNVKLANAAGFGIPIISLKEAGAIETQTGGESWIESPIELFDKLSSLSPLDVRVEKSAKLKAGAISISSIAEQYKRFIDSI